VEEKRRGVKIKKEKRKEKKEYKAGRNRRMGGGE